MSHVFTAESPLSRSDASAHEKREYDGKKVTIYLTSSFLGNVTRTEARLYETGRRRYAQYERAPYLKFKPKGKRKFRIWHGTFQPYAVVVEGWDGPDPGNGFNPSETFEYGPLGKVTGASAKYSSFDPRYKSDFDAVLEASGAKIIEDFREKTNEGV